jgi:hypothetical protein
VPRKLEVRSGMRIEHAAGRFIRDRRNIRHAQALSVCEQDSGALRLASLTVEHVYFSVQRLAHRRRAEFLP